MYGEPIPVKELADRVASYVHLCTLYWWLRFGKSIISVFITVTVHMTYCIIISMLLKRWFSSSTRKSQSLGTFKLPSDLGLDLYSHHRKLVIPEDFYF